MSAHRRAVRQRCTATLLLITLQGAACQAWHAEGVTPQVALETDQPTKVRVTRTDGRRIVLQHPVLQGDTLVGRGDQQQQVRIALTDVKQVATRGFSAGRTVGLGLGMIGVVGGALLATFAIVCSDNACN
jgi:hypothetical protein